MKNWSELTKDEKNVWLWKATYIIYPDLRTGYVKSEEMKKELGKSLYRCHVMMHEGGGDHQEGTEKVISVLEE